MFFSVIMSVESTGEKLRQVKQGHVNSLNYVSVRKNI